MVDAPAGMLGIEWIDGKSVRFLLGGGAEGEEVQEEDSDENDLQEQDPLQEYGVSQSRCMSFIQLWTYLNEYARYAYGIDRNGDREDAPVRHHPWRPHDFQHDAPTSIIAQRSSASTCISRTALGRACS